MEYDEYIKLRQMDPIRAETEKQERMIAGQRIRILTEIDNAKTEYKENVEGDPERKTIYLRNFRERILNIPLISEFDDEEIRSVYSTVKSQSEGLEVLEDQLNQVVNGFADPTGQPAQDDLGSDTPDTQEVVDPDLLQEQVEEEESKSIDERIEEPNQEELSSDEPDTQDSIESLQARYEAKTGNKAPARFKNNAERLQSKL